jgi:DNA-3-methyladenine glycosylase II
VGDRVGDIVGTASTTFASASMSTSHARAARVLAARDPVLARLVQDAGAPRFRPPLGTHFDALVRAVVHQQLAGAAAAAIHARLLRVLGGEAEPAALLALADEELRGVGLSANKAAALRDLAAKVLSGTVALDPQRLRRMADEDIITRLSSVRGIGRWTAEMFLMFQLRRLDVWPTGDLGVRRGYGLAFDVPPPAPRELELLGDRFRPYRSVAAWYCWRAVELYGRGAESALTR